MFCLVDSQERKRSGGRSTRTFSRTQESNIPDGRSLQRTQPNEGILSHQSQAFQNCLSPEIKKIPKAVKEKQLEITVAYNYNRRLQNNAFKIQKENGCQLKFCGQVNHQSGMHIEQKHSEIGAKTPVPRVPDPDVSALSRMLLSLWQ